MKRISPHSCRCCFSYSESSMSVFDSRIGKAYLCACPGMEERDMRLWSGNITPQAAQAIIGAILKLDFIEKCNMVKLNAMHEKCFIVFCNMSARRSSRTNYLLAKCAEVNS